MAEGAVDRQGFIIYIENIMNRWVIFILLVTFGLRIVSGGILMSGGPHGMDMESCEGATCGISTDQCFEHCLAVGQLDTILPAVTPSVFLLVMSALITMFAGAAIFVRSHGRATALAPPGLAFVRNTILRE